MSYATLSSALKQFHINMFLQHFYSCFIILCLLQHFYMSASTFLHVCFNISTCFLQHSAVTILTADMYLPAHLSGSFSGYRLMWTGYVRSRLVWKVTSWVRKTRSDTSSVTSRVNSTPASRSVTWACLSN